MKHLANRVKNFDRENILHDSATIPLQKVSQIIVARFVRLIFYLAASGQSKALMLADFIFEV